LLPNELKEDIITLPQTDQHTIVIVTGNGLRHQRFAKRIQQAFPDQVVAWYELDNTVSRKETHPNNTKNAISNNIQAPTTSKINKILSRLSQEIPKSLSKYGFLGTLKKMGALLSHIYYRVFIMRNTGKKMLEAEKALFQEELRELEKSTTLVSIKIHPNDVHGKIFIDEIKKLHPYFFLTLSGPLYRESLLQSIRGAAINQHAGHSPLFKGSNTIHWALYHRDLTHVSSTIHITTTGADAGQILRRSNPCLFPYDSIETVFLRTVALGTELMIESVNEIMQNKQVKVFAQPKSMGKTYLNKSYNFHIAKAVNRDFNTSWLHDELNNQRNF